MRTRIFQFLFAAILGFIAVGFFAAHASAATLSFQTSSAVVHQGQEIAVDVLLDPEGQNVNTVSVTVTIPKGLAFVGHDDSSSVIGLWVDEPMLSADGRSFSFSGIIPDGFSGLIDPFNSKTHKSGTLVRLLFKGKGPGAAPFSLFGGEAFLNDGSGTETKVITLPLSIVVDDILNGDALDATPPDTEPPLPFTPILERDLLLYDGQHVLIFNTKDKESGMDHYEVREGKGPWIVAVSPYILKDQKVSGDLYIKAIDRTGNERVEVVSVSRGVPIFWQIVIALAVLGGLIFAVIHFLHYIHTKHIQKN